MTNLKYTLTKPYLIFILLFLLSISNSSGFAKQKSTLNNFSTSCEIKKNKIVCLNLEINNDLKVNLLNSPFRISLNFEKKIIFINKNFRNHKFIKTAKFNKKNKSRFSIVLELQEPTIISDFTYNKINNNLINLDMQILKTTAANFAVAKYILLKNNGKILSLGNQINVSAPKKLLNPRSIVTPKEKPKFFKKKISKKKYNVFIDPGHGGKDPGAIGRLGTLEKDITLRTSVMLARALQKNNKINTILSRDKDIYLSLKKRTKLAKINNADIFISIHADSSINKKANGISVFSLSDKASDIEAQMLAKRENDVDSFLGNKNIIKDPIIYDTLIKMYQREAMNDSSILARKILSNLEKTKLAVNRGHRFAGFSVLKSYDIPSVLIEIGFLSNTREERKLLDVEYLNELSNGLAIAVENYFNTYK